MGRHWRKRGWWHGFSIVPPKEVLPYAALTILAIVAALMSALVLLR